MLCNILSVETELNWSQWSCHIECWTITEESFLINTVYSIFWPFLLFFPFCHLLAEEAELCWELRSWRTVESRSCCKPCPQRGKTTQILHIQVDLRSARFVFTLAKHLHSVQLLSRRGLMLRGALLLNTLLLCKIQQKLFFSYFFVCALHHMSLTRWAEKIKITFLDMKPSDFSTQIRLCFVLSILRFLACLGSVCLLLSLW